MKKRISALFLSLALLCALALPASAYDMGKVGENNIVSMGLYYMGFIDKDNSLWMWGDNDAGKLGNNGGYNVGNKFDPIQNIPVKVLEDVASVSCGRDHTAAIKTDGSLWMWGRNSSGELGVESIKNSNVPIKVMDNVAAASCGGYHTAAVKTDGSLWMWGGNGIGQLGNGTTVSYVPTSPVKVMDNVTAVSCGGEYTAAIKTDGSLWTWGTNGYWQLGIDSIGYSDVPVKVMDNVVAVNCGENHTAAIKTDGSLWVWGRSRAPEKVLDNVAAVSCAPSSDRSTAAIKTDGSLWMWGQLNNYGQLGNGTKSHSNTPVKVMDHVAAVSCGTSQTAAVKTDGTLWTWGYNFGGRLGYEDANDNYGNYPIQTVPKQVTNLTGPQGVRIYLNGGIGMGLLWTNAAGTIRVPTNPTKEGYTFGGWYTDAALTTPWNFNDKVVNTLTLYAKWTPVSSTAATTGKSTQSISLNGNKITIDAYRLIADNGGDVTYVKLRDIAALLENTGAKFNVDWRNGAIYVSSKSDYTTKNGTELKPITGTDGSYRWNTAPVLFDGETKALEGIVITDGNGGGHTFFKLRDLGEALGFTVDWSPEKGVTIETR